MDSTCPQDVGLPYMTGGRHAPDTLFLVAEGDFRFQRNHCVASRDWLAEVDEFVFGALEDLVHSRCAGHAESRGASGGGGHLAHHR